MLETPESRIETKTKSNSTHSRMIRDLNQQIIYQNDVIAELRRQLYIIGDVVSEGTTTDTKKLKVRDENKEMEVNIKDVCNGVTGNTTETNSKSRYKNIINSHFS